MVSPVDGEVAPVFSALPQPPCLSRQRGPPYDDRVLAARNTWASYWWIGSLDGLLRLVIMIFLLPLKMAQLHEDLSSRVQNNFRMGWNVQLLCAERLWL